MPAKFPHFAKIDYLCTVQGTHGHTPRRKHVTVTASARDVGHGSTKHEPRQRETWATAATDIHPIKRKDMTITTENFDELANSGKLVVIDFWATWCGPCRKVAPIIEELATEYEGRAIIGKADVEEQDDLAVRFGIRSVPTVVFVKNGEEVKDTRIVGSTSKQGYTDKINSLL